MSKSSIRLPRKAKTLILYTSGGAGHRMAAHSVQAALNQNEFGSNFEVKAIDIFSDSIGQFVTKVWNYGLNHSNSFIIGSMIHLHGFSEALLHYTEHTNLEKKIKAPFGTFPDIVISVTHTGNYIFRSLSQKNKAAFYIVPSDLDPSDFLRFMQDFKEKDPQFHIYTALDHAIINSKMEEKQIFNYTVVGYPVRKQFLNQLQFSKPNINSSLSASKSTPETQKPIFITLGSQVPTSRVLQIIASYKRHKFSTSQSIAIACSKNTELLQLLKSKTPEYKSHGIDLIPLGFLSAAEMAHWMANSVVVAKPGGSTIGEILAANSPTLLDSFYGSLIPWEGFALDFMTNVKQAKTFNSKNFDPDRLVRDTQKLQKTKMNPISENHFYQLFPKKLLEHYTHYLEFLSIHY